MDRGGRSSLLWRARAYNDEGNHIMKANTAASSTDVIFRVKGLTPEQAEKVEQALAPLARRIGGILNATDHEDHGDHRMVLRRRKIV